MRGELKSNAKGSQTSVTAVETWAIMHKHVTGTLPFPRLIAHNPCMDRGQPVPDRGNKASGIKSVMVTKPLPSKGIQGGKRGRG